MSNYNQMFERNLGFLTSNEQRKLAQSSVAIAGAGGDGGLVAVGLARMGVGEVRLADPDEFEIENINRQAVCNSDTIGVNKAEAVAEYLKKINPEIVVKVFNEGINQDNVGLFVQGCQLVLDETEYTRHELAVMLARSARLNNVPNLTAMNLGFGGIVTTFHPEKGKSVEQILGLDQDAPLDEIAQQEVDISRWAPYLPPYGDLKALRKVMTGEKSAPSVVPGVFMAGSLAVTQALLNLLGPGNRRDKKIIYSPRALVIDGLTGQAKITHFNRLEHYRSLGILVVRNILGLNPETSY